MGIWSRMVTYCHDIPIRVHIAFLVLLSKITGKEHDLTPLVFKLGGRKLMPRDRILFEMALKKHTQDLKLKSVRDSYLRLVRGDKK